jgi:hypothetical protein
LFALLRGILAWRRKRLPQGLWANLDEGSEYGTDHLGQAFDLPVLRDAVAEALRRLDEVREPRNAVVAAWVELETAASTQGWARDLAETTTEFTIRLLAGSPAPPNATERLRLAYQQARFSQHPITATQVAQARTDLEAIARSLEVRP